MQREINTAVPSCAQHNAASVGVYATVLRGGVIEDGAEAFLC